MESKASNVPNNKRGLARPSMEYTRHQPEETLLYQVIDEHYPEFLSYLSESDKTLPQYVQNEFEAYLKCGRLEHGFLRVQCESCQHEQLVAFSHKRRGFCMAVFYEGQGRGSARSILGFSATFEAATSCFISTSASLNDPLI